MKNLLFGLIATILFSFNGNAQKLTQEDVRLILAKGIADFSSSLKPAFNKSDNVEDFKKIITGCWYPKITKEGNNLLDEAYKLLSNKTSEDDILKNYDGKEMAEAALYVDALAKKGIVVDGSVVFGGTNGDFNPYATLFTSKCRWYQLGCWIKEIFGEQDGQAILHELSVLLINVITGI